MYKLVRLLVLPILIGCSTENGSHGHSSESQASEYRQTLRHTGTASASSIIDFAATDLAGKPFKGISLKDKTVLIDFWAVWCAPCIASLPTLNKLHNDLTRDNFEVVGIAVHSGGPADLKKFLENHKIDYRIIVGDENLIERFGVIGYPTYFLIGPDGKIRKQYVGEVKSLYSEIKREVLNPGMVK